MRQFWTEEDLQIVRWVYPHVETVALAAILGRTHSAVWGVAQKLGLKKTEEFVRLHARLRPGNTASQATQFKPGHVPANKGLRRPGWAPGRMASTQFKRGQRTGKAAENWCPVGAVRPDAGGFLRIKVREHAGNENTGFGNTKIWPLLSRHVWEQHHGPIPPDHAVVFRDRDRSNCDLANLELVTRAELMRRNTIHNLPEDLREVIQLTGVLKRKLRRREREEQTVGPA